MKNIETLVQDINELMEGDLKEVDATLFKQFGVNLEELFFTRFTQDRSNDPPRLRMSNIGKPDRQLWLDFHGNPEEKEKLPAHTRIKFSYGDLIEQMVLLYAKLAGHTVELEQAEVEVDGIKGHIDAVIDGVVVDVKSASTFSWQKFNSGALLEEGNDPFGYVAQLSGYVEALTPGQGGAFLAVDKTLGKLALLQVPAERIQEYRVRDRIAHIKQVVASEQIPPFCYPDVPDGKSGNMKLAAGCSYCARKFSCWEGLKTYYYSTGPRYLTKVVKEPKVQAEFPPE